MSVVPVRPHHRAGDYQTQPARLLEIDARLRAGEQPSHAALAKALGVSVRTIQRDFDHLRYTLGAPLAYDARRKGWRYSEETFSLPAVYVSADDVFALLLIRQALAQYAGTPYAEAAQRAFALVERTLPPRERLAAEWVRERVAFTDFPAPTIRREVWREVVTALRDRRTLRLTYAKPGARPERRSVDPLGLIVSEGDWYLYTWSHHHAARRTYLLSRVRKAEPTGSSFEIPADFDLAAYVQKGFAGLQADGAPPRTVRITFTKEASPLAAERKWHAEQRESWDRQGRLTIEFEVRAPFRVARRLAEAAGQVLRVEWLDSGITP
jgi:predicted DNA-binding transcriptional regulator YafY